MIKIAFCDDDNDVLESLHTLLVQYRALHDTDLSADSFHSPLDLIAEIERGSHYDILFLDILMPGENGIDTAAEIRSYDEDIKIIFLTSSSEFAVQSYTVNAFYYQLKPICAEDFFRLMDNILAQCAREQSDSLLLQCKSGIHRIRPAQLEFCEVMHRTLFLHLTDGEILEITSTLEELAKRLSVYGCFFRPHRSYLVNLEYVQQLNSRCITMTSQTEIPIPHGKYNSIKDIFLEYAFAKRQVDE